MTGGDVKARVEATSFHGLRALRLVTSDGSSAVLTEQGAHVVSWQAAGGRERLYLSPRSRFAPGMAIRGGIPVVFPQFADAGPLPRHGFARTADWRVGEVGSDGDQAWAAMHLAASEATRHVWPHEFAATVELRLGVGIIEVALRVKNTGGGSLSFNAALHTYLAVQAVDSTLVSGLQGRSCSDTGSLGVAPPEQALRATGGIDRIYFDVPPVLSVLEAGTVWTLTSRGFPDAVVWNPGAQACATLADMPADGWQRMLCVEAAAVGTPLRLEPGQCWTGSQRIACAAA